MKSLKKVLSLLLVFALLCGSTFIDGISYADDAALTLSVAVYRYDEETHQIGTSPITTAEPGDVIVARFNIKTFILPPVRRL